MWIVRTSQLLVVAIVAGLWEAASQRGWVDPNLLPPLSKIGSVLFALLHDDRLLSDLALTITEVSAAFTIVGPLGLLVGFFLGEQPPVYRALGPVLHVLLATPKSIFLPVFILAFGIGFLEKVIFAVTLSFFIVLLSGIAAAQSVPAGLVTVARSFGATRLKLYLFIYLPAMQPLIVEGLRMALIFSITGVLLAEMYGSAHGVGRLIFAWGEMFRMPELFAGVLLIVMITVAVNELLRVAENVGRSRRRGF